MVMRGEARSAADVLRSFVTRDLAKSVADRPGNGRIVDIDYVALVSGDPRGNKVFQHFTDWLTHNVDIHAPALARYETFAVHLIS